MQIKEDPDVLRPYLEDSSNLEGGYADEIMIPESIDELSRSLRIANSMNLPVTISGGGTGTTGSRIPHGGIVISMEKLNRILDISRRDSSAVLEAGVLVDEFKRAAGKEHMFYTCHPTESAAFVGGTVATNASGSRSFKYGATRNYVKRLKMVLPNGCVWDLSRGQVFLKRGDSRVRLPDGVWIEVPLPSYKMPDVKNAAGYYAKDGMDLLDLFIGQEGTLSVIAEIEIALEKTPAEILSSFVFFNKEVDALDFAMDARDISKQNRFSRSASMIDALSIEYLDSSAMSLLKKRGVAMPHSDESAVFFEQEVHLDDNEGKALDEWLNLISRHGVSLDNTWVAMNERDAEKFARIRHAIPEALNDIIRNNGFQKISADIAVPDDKSLEMVRFYMDSFNSRKIEHAIFGHIGENHLHVCMLPRTEKEAAMARELALAFARKGVSLGGTVSAEHGIGKIKHVYLEEMYGIDGVRQMAKIKKAFDPNCILGLDNIFSRQLLNY